MDNDDPHDYFDYRKQQYFCPKCKKEYETCRCGRTAPEGTAVVCMLMIAIGLTIALGIWLL